MIVNENGESVPNPVYSMAEEDTCSCCRIKCNAVPEETNQAIVDLALIQQQTAAAPAYEQSTYTPQQTKIPMTQMQDWSAQTSSGGYNDGPVNRQRALCIIL